MFGDVRNSKRRKLVNKVKKDGHLFSVKEQASDKTKHTDPLTPH